QKRQVVTYVKENGIIATARFFEIDKGLPTTATARDEEYPTNREPEQLLDKMRIRQLNKSKIIRKEIGAYPDTAGQEEYTDTVGQEEYTDTAVQEEYTDTAVQEEYQLPLVKKNTEIPLVKKNI
ncbi:4704_t:CDS:2, partial [Funneliformis geosporum]